MHIILFMGRRYHQELAKKKAKLQIMAVGFLYHIFQSGVHRSLIKNCWPMFITCASTVLPGVRWLLATLSLIVSLILLITLQINGVIYAFFVIIFGLVAFLYLKRMELRLECDWTARVGIFSKKFARSMPSELEAKIEHFTDRILQVCKNDYDEIIIASHSFGTSLAPIILAHACKKHAEIANDSRLKILTMGSIMPFHSMYEEANHLRDAISNLSENVIWYDFTSPRDVACCALVSVTKLNGIAHRGPICLNAQFHKIFNEEALSEAVKYPLRAHFLYLACPDNPCPNGNLFDWPSTLIDKRKLELRYKDRAVTNGPFFS